MYKNILACLVPSGEWTSWFDYADCHPVRDMMGLSRQTVVLAFQMDDGMSNVFFPTVGILLAGLTIAGISYAKWVKWVFPYFLIQIGIGIMFMIIAQLINYGPF